jgi:perosamine synthetase
METSSKNNGAQVYEFIANFKSDKAFFFYRGRVALYALLRAMNIKPGDEVIAQVFTCFHSITPIVRLGARPIYVDIDRRNFNLHPDKIEEKLTDKTKAILVQHTFGIPAEMDRILDIAKSHNLWIIEDSCHALGSKYQGQEVGTFGDAAFYSFDWHKPVVLGHGGATVVNNPALQQTMQELYDDFTPPPLRGLGVLYLQAAIYNWLVTPTLFAYVRDIYRDPRVKRLVSNISGNKKASRSQDKKPGTSQNKQSSDGIGIYNSRILPFQASRLFRKLDKFPEMVDHQQWLVSQYERLLVQTGHELLELDDRFQPIYYKYPILADCKREILEAARRQRIELSDMFISPLYPPWHRKIWESFGYKRGMCPTSENISDTIVPLSIHSKIRARDIRRTATLLAGFR